MAPERHSRGKAPFARYVIAGFWVLACAGVFLFLGPMRRDTLSQVAFMPTAIPAGLQHVGSSRHGDDEDYLTREERFAWQAAPPTSTRPGQDTMTVVTTSYRVDRVDPDLKGRLTGAVYDSVKIKPRARLITIRGHEGVLEVFPQQSGGFQLRLLTWIERPGVYIQISGVDLTERQLLETANSLREQ